MELLLQKLDEKFSKQTEQITQNVTEAIDDKLNAIMEENKYIINKVLEIESKLKSLEMEKRKNNLVFFGLEEIGKSEWELVDYIKGIIEESGVQIYSQEISNVYKIGKKVENKNRPVVVTLTTLWKKHLIFKNKSKLPVNIYVNEDFSKEILEKRKQLLPQVKEEQKKGNIVYLKQDKLIVKKPRDNTRGKRKREMSDSPNKASQRKASVSSLTNSSQSHFKNQRRDTIRTNDQNNDESVNKTTRKDIIKPNILNYVE